MNLGLYIRAVLLGSALAASIFAILADAPADQAQRRPLVELAAGECHE
jgi:hypothetical protein